VAVGADQRPALPRFFRVAEEEQAVMLDRAADRAAYLVPPVGRVEEIVVGIEREGVRRVQGSVLEKVERRTMEAVRTALGQGVDDSAGSMAKFRTVVGGLYLELLHRVLRERR